jgi:hypothetical protein
MNRAPLLTSYYPLTSSNYLMRTSPPPFPPPLPLPPPTNRFVLVTPTFFPSPSALLEASS